MTALIRGMRALLRVGTGLSFMVLILAVTVQVVGRSFATSPVWTEELTRFALLYLAGFGTGLALLSGDLVNVDLVSESLPRRGPWISRLVSALLVLVFAAMLVEPALRFTRIGAMQTSPAMGLPMNYAHGSILLLLTMLALAAALRLIAMLTGAADGRPDNLTGEIE
ncbi:MAG: TRAP transporter permease DctQ [Paracoccus sp.]|jgi:TRAP-type transport system small permease protein|nr:MAG: TRAP transporter permease DctQ [Paracoccus sp. (in: a-proteobacteria)]